MTMLESLSYTIRLGSVRNDGIRRVRVCNGVKYSLYTFPDSPLCFLKHATEQL